MSETNDNPEGIDIEQAGDRITIRVPKKTVPSHLEIEFQNDSTTGVKAVWGKVAKVVLDGLPQPHPWIHLIESATMIVGVVVCVVITIWRLTR